MNATDNSETDPENIESNLESIEAGIEKAGSDTDKPNGKGKKREPRSKFVNCKVCDHLISRTADMCPKCGNAKKTKKWLFRGSFFVAAFLFIVYHDPIIRTLHLPEMVDMVLHHLLGMPMDEGHP